jgi:hypothetical protein
VISGEKRARTEAPIESESEKKPTKTKKAR